MSWDKKYVGYIEATDCDFIETLTEEDTPNKVIPLNRCIHGKRPASCPVCDGSDLCHHGRFRCICRDCDGQRICVHKRRKTRCKMCGGSQLCKSVWCETRANPKYERFCVPCFVNNPENHGKIEMRNYKTKETAVVDKLKSELPEYTWRIDKKVEGGCSKRRPDVLLDLGSHVLIIEIDENRHIHYECSCENKRVMEISQDIGHRPLVIIRFNPDDYVSISGEIVKSCWRLTKLGVLQIVKGKMDEWNERIEILLCQVKYWIKNVPSKTVEMVELFY